MNTLSIKNLTIAVEALSRVPGYRVERLSDKILTELEELTADEPPAPKRTELNDEIPF